MRALKVFFVLALIGLGALWGQKIHRQTEIDACNPCYEACKVTLTELGDAVPGGFQWSECRDFCGGRDLCKDDFAFWYVGVAGQLGDWLGGDATVVDAVRSDGAVNGAKEPSLSPESKAPATARKNGPAAALKRKEPKQKQGRIQADWEGAKTHCASLGKRLPNKNELTQHLMTVPAKKRSKTQFWAIGPPYPNGFPPLVSVSSDSYSAVPGDPKDSHAVFCFPK